ncbi:hypothetical protein [Streptomyces natalensis]|uniref:Uncharacterized protein n=1 Tax=Streptomyces natalensis ATCC 27448 TaxID=1240678 RepID=A0A0D7CJT6_9ACTN|nr:hypothetical protein [Streptomyces natalensis]KIZ16499.1 hypothetical protein SNA_19435 [Streptomyces natalensis ATCC 27448]
MVTIMRWGVRPVWVRCMAAAYAVGFLEGTAWHAYCLATGALHAYSYAPIPIQLLFHALLLLDPLVALLSIRARPGGPLLAAVVMLADLVGNWYVNWRAVWAHPAAFLRPVGLLPITLFGILVLLTAFPLRRALTSGGDEARRTSQTASTVTGGTST